MVQGRAGGSVVYAKDCKTDGAKLAAAIYAAAVAMKEKDVPMEDTVCFLAPAQVALLLQTDKVTDRFAGNAGDYSKGEIGFIGGIKIIETNYLPNTNIAEPSATDTVNIPRNPYYGDFSKTAGLVMNKGAIGTITRKGLTVEATWLPEELTWLLTARTLEGHGILDPRRAVEIRDDDAPVPSGSST